MGLPEAEKHLQKVPVERWGVDSNGEGTVVTYEERRLVLHDCVFDVDVWEGDWIACDSRKGLFEEFPWVTEKANY